MSAIDPADVDRQANAAPGVTLPDRGVLAVMVAVGGLLWFALIESLLAWLR